MNRIILFTALMLTLVTSATAQFSNTAPSRVTSGNDSYGRFMIAYTNSQVKIAGLDFGDLNKDQGVSIGAFHGGSVSRDFPLYLETGFRMSWVMDKMGDNDASIREDFIDVSVPLNLVIKAKLANNIYAMPYAGLNFKCFIYGQGKTDGDYISNETCDYFSEDDMGSTAFKRFQFGWNAGLGFALGNFYIGYQYQKDFTKLCKLVDAKLQTHFIGIGTFW